MFTKIRPVTKLSFTVLLIQIVILKYFCILFFRSLRVYYLVCSHMTVFVLMDYMICLHLSSLHNRDRLGAKFDFVSVRVSG